MPASCRDCPIPGTGCQCLQAYAADQAVYAAALDRIVTGDLRVLRVVTMPADTAPGHDPASMVCPCAACELDRQAHAQRAKRQIPQPWEARRAA